MMSRKSLGLIDLSDVFMSKMFIIILLAYSNGIEKHNQWSTYGNRKCTGTELLATSQLTIHPLPPKVGKFKWNYIFFRWKISNLYCILQLSICAKC